MLSAKFTPLDKTGLLSPLVQAYLNNHTELKKFYSDFPDVKGFKSAIQKIEKHSFNRRTLIHQLKSQAEEVSNGNKLSLKNIELLASEKTFTVTTGHQLCLFTGPLYFIYKIFSAINLCEELKSHFPKYDFVPVYWMASEDHDFAEVNHLHLFGKKIEWRSEEKGAVGNFSTAELQTVFEELQTLLGSGPNADHLKQLFADAYLKNKTLAKATRYLVNELFGEYGLITVDGNDTELKKNFASLAKKELLNEDSYSSVSESIAELDQLGYKSQVNPRTINLFYIDKQVRSRIDKEGEQYIVKDSNLKFSEEEILNLLSEAPEKISPNVVLRPLYQQQILPNIAYVGGPGEIAYWLEYKKMFDAFAIHFPVLVARNFVTVIEKNIQNKIGKLKLETEDVFRNEKELQEHFQKRSGNVFDTEAEKEIISQTFTKLTERIAAIDPTLAASTQAEKQKALNSLDMLSGKVNKALKTRSETEMNQLKAIREKLFPENIPQERYDNFAAYYLKYGKEFFTTLKREIKILDAAHLSLLEV